MEPKDIEQKQPENVSETTNKSRRNFIRNAGLAGLTAGATTLVGRDQSGEPANAETPKTDGAIADEVRAMHGGAPIYDAPFKTADGIEPVLPPLKERVLALKQLLIEKKLISDQAIQGFVNYYENIVGPHFGAAVVAHAWKNPDWQAKLLAPPTDQPFQAALLIRDFLFNTPNPDTGKPYLSPEITFGLTIGPEGEYIRIVANGEQQQDGKTIFVHNLVTCTVCSCYPQALLGTQPMWYKSQQYRARSVADPFGILVEFAEDANQNKPERLQQFKNYGAKIDELRVWDSNSEVRFFVIPEMPKIWGNLSENELRKRVTRNAMLGAEILYV
jgi:nitrile hydratase